MYIRQKYEAAIGKVAIYVLTEVRHTGCGRYRQRGRFIQGLYIQWALYAVGLTGGQYKKLFLG